MSFNEKLPDWGNPGTEPPESKKQAGFLPSEKPPADWFNWLFNRAYKVLEEIRSKVELIGNKGKPGGYAGLDNTGKIPPELLPDGQEIVLPDASLTEKGIVQLSNATNGIRENVAATEKAVGQAFQAGNERKAEVVAALVAIGVQASTSETWAHLIPKIAAVIRATGNATAADILAPKTASNASGPITGTIPVLTGIRTATGTAKWGDGALAVYPEKGYQKGGSGDGEIKVTTAQLQAAEPNLNSAYILSNRPIFGVPGGIANRSAENNHMPGLETTVWAGDRFFIRPPKGYYDGLTWVTAAVPGLTAANLRNGVSVANLVGALVEGKKYMQGSVTPNANGYYVIPVNGFTPSRGFMWQGDGTGWFTPNTLYMGCLPTNPDGTPNLAAESGTAVVTVDSVTTYVSNGFTQPNNVFFPGSVFLRTGNKMTGTAKYILFE